MLESTFVIRGGNPCLVRAWLAGHKGACQAALTLKGLSCGISHGDHVLSAFYWGLLRGPEDGNASRTHSNAKTPVAIERNRIPPVSVLYCSVVWHAQPLSCHGL